MFNSTANDYRNELIYGNSVLENVKEYKYLGLTLTKLNKFNRTKETLVQR